MVDFTALGIKNRTSTINNKQSARSSNSIQLELGKDMSERLFRTVNLAGMSDPEYRIVAGVPGS